MKLKRIKELRENSELTQKELAKLLNITQQQYSLYENGIREPKIEHIIKLCKFYHITSDYILELPRNLPYPEE